MELLTIRETAQVLKVSSITVRRYIADGRLPAVRVGKGIRVRKEAVDKLVTPVAPKPKGDESDVHPEQTFTMDDPLWDIVGIGSSGSRENVSGNKHEHLADAYDVQGA